MGCYWRYLGPGGVRTDDGAQKRELPVEGRWRGVGVIHAERGRGGETSPEWCTRNKARMPRVACPKS